MPIFKAKQADQEKIINQTVSLIDDRILLSPPSSKFWSFKKITAIFFIVFFTLGGGVFYRLFASGGKIFGRNESSFLNQVKNLLLADDKKDIVEQKRVNILLMGMRGLGHVKDQGGGTFLSDTNIIFSLKPGEKQAAMLSLPRDLLIYLDDFGRQKINAAYAIKYNQTHNHDQAANYAKEVFSKVTGLEIDYYIKVDFVGFEKIIDILGGVDIEVDKSFTDSQYPDVDYGYQIISFQAGWEHMNGDRALKYVRSRHGNNGEGSDFGRARRQQKVLTAVKQKLFSFSIFLNTTKIDKIASSLGDHVRTDLELVQALEVYKLASAIKGEDIINRVVDNGASGLVHSTTTNEGAYVLIPNKGEGNFSEIQSSALNIFDNNQNSTNNSQTAEVKSFSALVRVQVKNGTAVKGLAGLTAEKLKQAGFEVVGIGNASTLDFDENIIYDYTNGKLPEALSKLITTIGAKSQAGSFYPLGDKNETDFLVVLGQPQ